MIPALSRRFLIYLLPSVISASVFAADAPLVPTELLANGEYDSFTSYRCPPQARCAVSCRAGTDQVDFDRESVMRFEMIRGKAEWLVVAVFQDAVGQAHQSLAFLPVPASCAVENLRLVVTMPAHRVSQPGGKKEVVFDLVPGDT